LYQLLVITAFLNFQKFGLKLAVSAVCAPPARSISRYIHWRSKVKA